MRRGMTLSRKMAWKNAAVLVGLVLLVGASLWGLTGLHGNFRRARDEYSELRQVQEVVVHVTAARALLVGGTAQVSEVCQDLERAIESIDAFAAFQQGQRGADPTDQQHELNAAARTRDTLQHVLSTLAPVNSTPVSAEVSQEVIAELDQVLNRLGNLTGEMDEFVAKTQAATTAKLQRTILVISALSAVILLVTIAINVSQYRSVVTPLRRLRRGVRAVASGNFNEPLEETGDREFRELAGDFNRMADELRTLYGDLEQQVRAKSRELVRSERLASVGYLAAGVAHEINNPLGIISGHAELSLRRIEDCTTTRAAELSAALTIIRDEAFRCKDITQKLLSLTYQGSDGREPVSLLQTARDVVSLIGGIRPYRDRRLSLALDPAEPLLVNGNSSELKQVLLNLALNALEATPPQTGLVVIEGRRLNGRVELCVRDNGRGMTPEVLERVFEPFFSQRPRGAERGTGLGLAITHAIVESHGGRIRAESEGTGHGSRFILDLPATSSDAPGGKAARYELATGYSDC